MEQVPSAKVDVNVHAIWDDDLGTVLFALGGEVHNSRAGEKVDAHSIVMKAGSAERIKFKLVDHTNLRLKFSSSGPFRVQGGLECPTSHDEDCGFGTDADPEMSAELNVRNPGAEGIFTYALVFDGDGKEYECDPIIKNIA